jgi:hypothetical protein
MTGRGRGRRVARPVGLVAGLITVLITAVAGCGGPAYTYVTNSQDHTYLRVPVGWRQLDTKAVAGALGIDPADQSTQAGFWLQGYDADPRPSVEHLTGQVADAPAVFIGVRDVPASVRGQISLDLLRNLFRPVSDSAREQDALNPTSQFSGFSLVSDQVLAPSPGLRGVHVVYVYRIDGGPPQTFDQIVYVNDDASKLYMFYVRCSTQCYGQRKPEITNVVSSFTVRETPA